MQYLLFNRQFFLFSLMLILPVLIFSACSRTSSDTSSDISSVHNSDNVQVEIEQSWIPAAPPSVDVLAGYFTLSNHLEHDLVLVSANSPLFEYIELHSTTSIDYGRLVEMNKLPKVIIAAGSQVVFKPGGNHLMLYKASGALKVDQKVPVSLVFEKGTVIDTTFTVTKQRLQPEQGGWF